MFVFMLTELFLFFDIPLVHASFLFFFSFPRVLLDRNGLNTVRVVFDSKDKAVEICERIEDGIDGKRHVKHVHLRQQATRRNTANPFRDHFTTSLQEKRSSGRLSLQR